MTTTERKLAWHVHHNILFEELTQPIKNRISYIIENKLAPEVETRLSLLKLVRFPLPQRCNETYQKFKEASQKWNEAYQKWDEAYQKWDEAYQKWDVVNKKRKEAYQKYDEAMEEYHSTECRDCPWDGKTIFPMRMREVIVTQ